MPRANAGYVPQVHRYWIQQDDLVVEEIPPNLNEWYVLIAPTEDIRAYFFNIYQSNDETAVKNVEVEFTTNLMVKTMAWGLANNSLTFLEKHTNDDDFTDNTTRFLLMIYSPYDCQSLGIRIRQTGAIGTNQILRARLIYALWRDT